MKRHRRGTKPAEVPFLMDNSMITNWQSLSIVHKNAKIPLIVEALLKFAKYQKLKF